MRWTDHGYRDRLLEHHSREFGTILGPVGYFRAEFVLCDIDGAAVNLNFLHINEG